jgi:hypothetical protein
MKRKKNKSDEQKERKEKSLQGKKILPTFTLRGLPGNRKALSAYLFLYPAW